MLKSININHLKFIISKIININKNQQNANNYKHHQTLMKYIKCEQKFIKPLYGTHNTYMKLQRCQTLDVKFDMFDIFENMRSHNQS